MLLANKVPPIISQLGFSFCELNGVVFRADIQPVKKKTKERTGRIRNGPGVALYSSILSFLSPTIPGFSEE